MAYDYSTIHCRAEAGVMTATLDNPPANVMTRELFRDLMAFTTEVAEDDSIKVVVFDSADAEFFIAHFDVDLLLRTPIDTEPQRQEELNGFHQMCCRVATMPKATIAKIAGRAGGGGSEFATNCDMRFGVSGRTVINQMEVALGILPGGTGTQTLPRLVGRGRAMEIILGSDDIDATTAAQWGYLNRVFGSEADMDAFVDALASRIASWPATAIALAKQSINNAASVEVDGLLDEAFLFQQTLRTSGAQTNMKKAMELGAQTRDGESRIAELCLEAARSNEL